MFQKYHAVWPMLAALLFPCLVCLGAPDFTFTAEPGKTPEGIRLEEGATVTPEGYLQLNGHNARACVEKYDDWELTPEGFTGIITVRSRRDGHRGFFGKTGVFAVLHGHRDFGAHTDISKNGVLHANRIRWEEFIPNGQFVQLALTAKKENNSADGRIGYLFSCYLNGELLAQERLFNFTPDHGTGAFWLGNAGGGYGLDGEIAAFEFHRHPLADSEIADIALQCPFIKAKLAELPEDIRTLLTANDQDTHFAAWLKQSLLSAFAHGGNAAKVTAAGKALGNWQSVSDFNAAQPGYLLLETPVFYWLLARQGRGEAAFCGAFDKRTDSRLQGQSLLGWSIKTPGSTIADNSPTLEFALSNLRASDGKTEFDLLWTGEKLRVIARVMLAGPRLEVRLEVDNQDEERRLSKVIFPDFRLQVPPGKGVRYLTGGFSGEEYALTEAPRYNFGSDYPSSTALPLTAFYDGENRGIYLAFEEEIPVFKKLGHGVLGEEIRLNFATDVPIAANAKGGNSYQSSGAAVLEAFSGEWFEAGQIYKRFLQDKSSWYVRDRQAKGTPAWFRDNALNILGGRTNELLYLREYLEMPFLSDRSGFWYDIVQDQEPPTAVPREGYQEDFRRLHAAGIRIQAYFNPRLYGYSPRPTQCRDWLSTELAQQNSIRNEDGTLHCEVDNPFSFPVLCWATPFTQKHWHDRVKYMIEEVGIDSIYLDQTIDAHPVLCYAKEHGHPLNSPYLWHQSAFQVLSKLHQEYPDTAFTGEGGTDCWATAMDGYLTWLYGLPNTVPLMQSIFGGGRVQFLARGFESFGNPGSYDGFFCRLAEQFVCTEQLGWFNINDFRFAGFGRRRFVKKLAHLRRALLPYFNDSDMLAPLKYRSERPRITTAWGNVQNWVVTKDKIAHAVWKRSDGKIVIPFVNTTTETVTISVALPYSGKLVICREDSDEPLPADASNPPSITLNAHECQIWFLDPDEAVAADCAAILHKAVSFDDGENLPYAQDFSVCNSLTVTDGQWFAAKEASWMVLAFQEKEPTLGFSNRGPEEVQSNWVAAKEGGLVFFGEIDFGEGNGESVVELELSVQEGSLGGRARLVDLTGEIPDRTLAEIVPDKADKPFDFTVFRAPLQTLSGKHKVAWSFDRPMLMRRWRVVRNDD